MSRETIAAVIEWKCICKTCGYTTEGTDRGKVVGDALSHKADNPGHETKAGGRVVEIEA